MGKLISYREREQPSMMTKCVSSFLLTSNNSGVPQHLLDRPDEDTFRIMVATDNHVGYMVSKAKGELGITFVLRIVWCHAHRDCLDLLLYAFI